VLARPGASPQRQPGLPLGKGHIPTQTHDYYRTGKVTLFAALDYLHGKVIAHTAQTHTHRFRLHVASTICHIDRISAAPILVLAIGL
jgi:hypothetical protein